MANKENCKILDFGTGSGVFALALSQVTDNGAIYAIDTVNDKSQKDPNFNDTANEQRLIWNEFEKSFKINFDHYDGCVLPFSDNSFDMIVAYAVVEHIEPSELSNIFNELKRVLKKDGLFFIFKTPRKLAYTEHLASWLRYGCHEILYGDDEINEILRANKFKILKNWKSNMVPEFPDKITNPLYPVLRKIDTLLNFYPVRMLAHHNNFVIKKCLE